MPGDLQVIASYSDFQGGEYGGVASRRAPKGSFSATNMLRYRDGSVGPRAGLQALGITGLPSGRVWMLAWPTLYGRLAYVVVDRYLYSFDPSTSAAATLLGDLGGRPTRWIDHQAAGGKLYLTSWGQGTWVYTPATATFVALSGASGPAPTGRAIALYGERLLIGGDPTVPARVWYSDASVFTSWPSTNFFDVSGEAVEVRGVYLMRDFGVIVAADTSIYVLTGTPGSTAQLRRVVSYPEANVELGGFQPQRGAMDLASRRLWFTAQHVPAPGRFNGAAIESATYLEFGSSSSVDQVPPPYGASALVEPDEEILPGILGGICV